MCLFRRTRFAQCMTIRSRANTVNLLFVCNATNMLLPFVLVMGMINNSPWWHHRGCKIKPLKKKKKETSLIIFIVYSDLNRLWSSTFQWLRCKMGIQECSCFSLAELHFVSSDKIMWQFSWAALNVRHPLPFSCCVLSNTSVTHDHPSLQLESGCSVAGEHAENGVS